MLKPGDKVLLAVSGGPDSLTLFRLFLRFQSRFDLALHVFHLNHMMRKEAAADAAFVKKLAEQANISATILSYDVPAYVKQERLSRQEGARKIRYVLLEQVAEEVEANKIALGHQADDQVETFLQRVLRGAGSEGLRGIPPVRGYFIRPLIETTRQEIEAYCLENNLSPRFDSSNLSLFYQRNKIRRELIPYITSHYNSRVKEVLLREAQILADEYLMLDNLAREKFKQLAFREDGLLKIDYFAFSKLPVALQRRLLRKGIEQVKGDLRRIEFKNVEKIIAGLKKEQTKLSFNLPAGLVVFREYGHLIVTIKNKLEKPDWGKAELAIPGRTKIPILGVELEASFVSPKEVKFLREETIAFLDAAKVKLPLILRPRRPGDRFKPLGMKETKKLQDFFVDQKIPARRRDRVPLVESENKIVWVVGYRIGDEFKVTKQTKQVLKLEVKITNKI